MRKIACLAPALALSACAAAPPPVAPIPGSQCNASGTAVFIGQRRSPETGTAILAATGSSQLRWVTPGMMVTMEFLPTRVTVHVGEDGRITRIVCG